MNTETIKKRVEDHYNKGKFINQATLLRYERELRRLGVDYNSEFGNILVIPDLHCPFLHPKAIPFLKKIKKKYKPGRVILLGDIIDNHFLSFHDTDPNGLGGKREFEEAMKQVQKIYKLFPEADVLKGNHDQLPDRKAFKSGLIKSWLKPIKEMLNVPGWTFHETLVVNDILFTHGIGMQAKSRMRKMLMSVIQGHYHTKTYLTKVKGFKRSAFAMQLGCLMNQKSYAAAYSRFKSTFQLNVAIIENLSEPKIIDLKE